MDYSLQKEHKAAIGKYLSIFQEYLCSSHAQDDQKDRKAKTEYFQSLTKEQLLTMDESMVQTLVSNLWATQFWKNQQYILDQIITENSLDKLRKEFAELICGKDSIEERYAHFFNNISRLGPSSITEILALSHPTECGIWNDKARKALNILGFSNVLPVDKYKITANELKKFNQVCNAIALELKSQGYEVNDLLGVDYFLYEVTQAGPTKQIVKKTTSEDFDHDEICEHVRDIGLWLGFKADTEQKISSGAKVDVIWRSEIGNLGVVTYVFEVQRKGSIDGLILNLQRAKANPTVQKVVAISDSKQLEQIRNEIHGLPKEFQDSLAFWDVKEVELVYQNLSEAMTIVGKLELVKDMFPIEGE